MQIPEGIKKALAKSTPDKVQLFHKSLEFFDRLGLNIYCTNSPDIRAKHPLNDIVFVTLWFQSQKGVRFEIRVDSCPSNYYMNHALKPEKLKQYDSDSRARWAIFGINGKQDLNIIFDIIDKIKKVNPAWG